MASAGGSDFVHLLGASESVKSSAASGNHDGILIGGDSGKIQSSSAVGNGSFGIFITGDSGSVSSSTASGNGVHGVEVLGDAAKLSGNRAEANGFAGGSASDLTGLGIFVPGSTTAPVGTNVARGNDDPAECDPTSLC